MITRPTNQETAVSPVVAVILLVAVTVTLSAVIGGFALELGQSTTSDTNQQSVGVSTSQSDGMFTATVVTGSADKAKLLVNGTTVDNVSNPSAGDTLTANVSNGDDVTIVTVTDGSSTVTSSQTITSSTTVLAPTDGLVARWKLDETSGDTAADIINGNDGNVSGATMGVAGVDGTAYEFNGSSDHIVASDSNSLDIDGNALTIGVWVNYNNTPSNTIVRKHDGGVYTNDENYGFLINSTEHEFVYNDGGTWYVKTSGQSIPTGEWHHIAVVVNGSTIEFYTDGKQVATRSHAGTLGSNPSKLNIGSSKESKRFFDGRMDDLRIYNRTLTESEVGDLYNATK